MQIPQKKTVAIRSRDHALKMKVTSASVRQATIQMIDEEAMVEDRLSHPDRPSNTPSHIGNPVGVVIPTGSLTKISRIHVWRNSDRVVKVQQGQVTRVPKT
jgi:hypothetical protein